ncbi:MAG TPA: helix-turn-helix domain-containing protein [Nitrososphaerales archaeon]|nr:helix-turn-helix domain-containing protein [Nitrososphaerales archaeon]
MTHYELGFKLQHDCPYNDLSKKYPSMIMSQWCNHEKDILEISYKNLDNFQDIQGDLVSLNKTLGVRPIRRAFTNSNVQVMTQHCACTKIKTSTAPVFERHNCLELEPTILRGGWEWYRVIAFSKKDIKALFDDLDKFCKVEMVSRRTVEDGSMRDTFIISTVSLFGELTEKQAQALVLALNSGYYRVPKKATTEEIAGRLSLPRTTYEEHLRKAESKVLMAVAPYLQLGQPHST